MRPRNGRRVTQGERETSQNGRLWAMNARGSCLTVRDSRAVRTSEKVVDSMQNPSQQQTRLLERETADLIRRVASLDNGKMALFDAHLWLCDMGNHLDAAHPSFRVRLWHLVTLRTMNKLVKAINDQRSAMRRDVRRRWSAIDTDVMPVTNITAILDEVEQAGRDA